MQGQALPGFRDSYPEELALRNYLFATWRDVARRYGFQEYDGPPLEPLELYAEKSGEEIVQQLYAFVDKGGRNVALRPEMTPTLARMVGARAQALKKPIRWFAIPQLFRYERQQRGRLREHFQLNMDIIGEPGPAADAEVMAAGLDIMRSLGLEATQVRLRVSDRRIVTAQLTQEYRVTATELPGVLAGLDKWDRHPAEADALLRKELGNDARVGPILEFMSGLREQADALRKLPVAEPLNECCSRLEAMGLGQFVEVDFRIVRGLAYYTGIVFELFDAGKSLRAICGGGRYDDLLKQISGIDLPCVGFGMGDVVLGELLRELGKQPEAPTQLDAFLVAVGGEDVAVVLKLAAELRERGLAVEYALRHQPIRKQLELAAARGAARAVIIGPDERRAKNAIVRDLNTGKQRNVSLAKVRKGTLK
ncbi:MAG: histidine--tRNA ligase [Gemmatimonadetes bacterium 13_1_40CM_70_11]|nr:MAG: histidine--tRNA ligase [Gemmatimonadetes bacterium 13_1_40CM_70_11]